MPSNPAAILAQYSTRPYKDTGIASYAWESLLRAAGMYPDDAVMDVTAAFVKEATIFDPFELKQVHAATERPPDALDQAKDTPDDMPAGNYGLYLIRTFLRTDTVSFAEWAVLADADKRARRRCCAGDARVRG